jgi:hypothetical protein
MSDKRRRMLDTGNDDGHFLPDDGRFFPDDGHFSVHVGQIFFHVGQSFFNDGHFFENVGQSRAVLDVFFQMLNEPVKMLDHPSRKAKGMLNVWLQMSDKRDRTLNVWQKILDIAPRMLNDPAAKKMKMLDIPVRESMNVEKFLLDVEQ